MLWIPNVEIHLAAKGLDDTIIEGNEASNQDKAKIVMPEPTPWT